MCRTGLSRCVIGQLVVVDAASNCILSSVLYSRWLDTLVLQYKFVDTVFVILLSDLCPTVQDMESSLRSELAKRHQALLQLQEELQGKATAIDSLHQERSQLLARVEVGSQLIDSLLQYLDSIASFCTVPVFIK